MTPLAVALVWLAASLILAPLVGRAIRLGHRRDRCPTCIAIRAAREARAADLAAIPRHPSMRCMCCPGAPYVADYAAHSATHHRPATDSEWLHSVGIEDL